MTLKRFNQTESQTTVCDPTPEASFPKIVPVDGGEIERRGRGIVGWIHAVEDEDAVAFCSTKVSEDHYFGKYNGYSMSIDVIETIQARADRLVDEGVIAPSDTETVYVLFFIQDEQEVLQFTLEQYQEDGYEYTNSGGNGPTDDKQRVLPEDKSKRRWEDGFMHVVKVTEVSNQTYVSRATDAEVDAGIRPE